MATRTAPPASARPSRFRLRPGAATGEAELGKAVTGQRLDGREDPPQAEGDALENGAHHVGALGFE